MNPRHVPTPKLQSALYLSPSSSPPLSHTKLTTSAMDETLHSCTSNNAPHVAVLSFPFASHPMSLFMLVRRLIGAAPDVMFSFFGTGNSNAMIFKNIDKGLENLRTYDVDDGIPENYVFTGKRQEDIELFMKVTPWNFKKSLEVAVMERGKKITCLLSDAFLWFSADVAEELGVPWIAAYFGGACGLTTHVNSDLIRSTIGVGPSAIAGREDETLDFIPGLSSLPIRDVQEGIIIGDLESAFNRMLHQMGQKMPQATAVVVNDFEELNPPIIKDLKSKFRNCLSVAPFTLNYPPQSDSDTSGCLSWLDKQKPSSVVYISFGTVGGLPLPELEVLAEGLEASGTPFLWSLKDKLKEQLPDSFLNKTRKRGLIVPWVPQLRVLQHTAVGVFMTHCGWNSVLESILNGIPVIGRPIFGDHHLNGRFISDVWKIGIRIDHGVYTKDGVMKGLDLMLCKEEGKKMMEKAQALKELAKRAIEIDGSTSRNFQTLLQMVSTT
ncbi:anthocyanidin 3-O-glucosyltransferase 7-like isoform X1 [Macadamia integrifolia]|uniref:anthocyanidin 3-O-glucosyltransferase 7-like isoform X1 n=1 Tax=Macadamia integrifolia TaxID=60698 RepID=UPI001C4E5898|nr:anthocyanidin 3-O-glucosyltransferase 7-like isoform X1 [Macadamia integrifolia]